MPEGDSLPAGLHRRSAPLPIRAWRSESDGFSWFDLLPDGRLAPKEGGAENAEATAGAEGGFGEAFATPGLVDLQVNGFGGVDFNGGGGALDGGQLDRALADMARTGVGAFLPTLITSSAERMIDRLRDLDAAVSSSLLGPHMVAGYHIEGPFLSPEDGYSGAHDGSRMTAANIGLIDRLQEVSSRPIRLVTLAPEVEGAIELIRALAERGVHVSIGHSAAGAERISAAAEAGARFSTHLGNGLPQMLHKTENPIFRQLADDRLSAMFIADGIHVPVPALKAMLRAKGSSRSILTTDAVAAAGRGTKPGPYTLGDADIELREDGSVRIPGSEGLAGSSVTMERIMRNMIEWFGHSVPELLRLMRDNPLRVLSGGANGGDDPPTGAADCVIEWGGGNHGMFVRRAHIGPFTVEGT